jgi:hypothetical protein
LILYFEFGVCVWAEKYPRGLEAIENTGVEGKGVCKCLKTKGWKCPVFALREQVRRREVGRGGKGNKELKEIRRLRIGRTNWGLFARGQG